MSRSFDLSLYLVTDTGLCGALGVAETVRRAAAAGVTLVQVRDPDVDDDTFVTLAREVADALRGTGIPLLVNDRVHLAGAIGADGAHVGQGDLDPLAARAVLDREVGGHAVLGLSVQTLEHVDAAGGLPSGTVDYLGAGPVWAQTTKPDAAPPSGLDGLRAIVSASPFPVVAIGGIGVDGAAGVRATGADGIAVVSAICGRPDVAAATTSLRQAWDGAAASREGARA